MNRLSETVQVTLVRRFHRDRLHCNLSVPPSMEIYAIWLHIIPAKSVNGSAVHMSDDLKDCPVCPGPSGQFLFFLENDRGKEEAYKYQLGTNFSTTNSRSDLDPLEPLSLFIA